MFTFVVDSIVRGYHEYIAAWENPVLGDKFSCVRELGSPHNPTAFAIKKIGSAIITIGNNHYYD